MYECSACVSVCVPLLYVCLCTTPVLGAHKAQRRKSEPQELELQRVVSHHTVLGTKPWASATASVLNCGPLSSPLTIFVFETKWSYHTSRSTDTLLMGHNQNTILIIIHLPMCALTRILGYKTGFRGLWRRFGNSACTVHTEGDSLVLSTCIWRLTAAYNSISKGPNTLS